MITHPSIEGSRFLVDGAVFSADPSRPSSTFLRTTLRALRDHKAVASVLLFDACKLHPDDDVVRNFALRYAPFEPCGEGQHEAYHAFTHFLTQILTIGAFDCYIDSDPFGGPLRLDTPAGPTIALLCDDTMLKTPMEDDQRGARRRRNGLMRLDRAEAILCPSEEIRHSVCQYLGKCPDDVLVLRDAENLHGSGCGSSADDILASAAARAGARYRQWRSAARFQVFSSLPGEGCGVADFTVAYLRAAPARGVLHFSKGDPDFVAGLDCKLFSYLDFEAAGDLLQVPRLFHFAVSAALLPGLDLLRISARRSDVVMIHERWYSDGFVGMLRLASKSTDPSLDYFLSDKEATELTQRVLLLSTEGAPHPPMADWLARLPVTIVSPLSPRILEQVKAYRGPDGEPARNELAPLEKRIAYVPMGIDDRAKPSTLRAARRHRIESGIGVDALVIGHLGLILDHPKMLRKVLSAFVQAGSEFGWSLEGRPIHFKLCGKIVEADIVTDALALFRSHGGDGRLHLSNPSIEQAFDAEMAACDALLCFRVQSRGQQSHAMARALSLGVPVIVNRRSGWSYDEETVVEDDDIDAGLKRVLKRLASPDVARLKASARAHFERAHRVDELLSMLMGGDDLARAV